MKNYEIPILYESVETFNVEAESLEEAVTLALKKFLSIPDPNYLCDSFQIDDIVLDRYEETYDYQKVLDKI